MRFYLIIIAVLYGHATNGQRRIQIKNSDSVFATTNKAIIKDLNEIKESIKAADDEKFTVGILTISVAFFAVLVSCLTGYLNYRAFKGQSISSFRKNWNNELITNVSEFLITSSAAFNSLKGGVKPVKFDEDILKLNKIKNVMFFKLKEIEVAEIIVYSAMGSIINQLLVTAKNDNATNASEFVQQTTALTEACSGLLAENWRIIKKFD